MNSRVTATACHTLCQFMKVRKARECRFKNKDIPRIRAASNIFKNGTFRQIVFKSKRNYTRTRKKENQEKCLSMWRLYRHEHLKESLGTRIVFLNFSRDPRIAVNSVKLTKLPSRPVKEVRVAIQ